MSSLSRENSASPERTHEGQENEEEGEENLGPSEMLPYLSDTLEAMNVAFSEFDVCSEYFINLPSEYDATRQEADLVSQEIEQHELSQTAAFQDMKAKLADEVKQQVLAGLSASRGQISDLIREEATKLVKEQVDVQIGDHMPVSLFDQAEESKRQLQEIRVSLRNSESRMNNSFIQISNLDDPLAPILTPTGAKSPLYPSNVKSLFNYDVNSAKALSKDYGLSDSDDLHMNLKQFLKHIGTSVEIVTPSDS